LAKPNPVNQENKRAERYALIPGSHFRAIEDIGRGRQRQVGVLGLSSGTYPYFPSGFRRYESAGIVFVKANAQEVFELSGSWTKEIAVIQRGPSTRANILRDRDARTVWAGAKDSNRGPGYKE
jgi:hypothetical protein